MRLGVERAYDRVPRAKGEEIAREDVTDQRRFEAHNKFSSSFCRILRFAGGSTMQ